MRAGNKTAGKIIRSVGRPDDGFYPGDSSHNLKVTPEHVRTSQGMLAPGRRGAGGRERARKLSGSCASTNELLRHPPTDRRLRVSMICVACV